MGSDVTRIFDLLDLYREKYADRKQVFTFRKQGEWRSFSAEEYVRFADWVSSGLLAMDVQRGDKIATIVSNCPAWNYLDMGIMQIGAVHVPIYPTLSAENLLYIFNHADIRFVFISGEEIHHRIKDVLHRAPRLEAVFSIDKMEGVRHWKELLNTGQANADIEAINERKSNIDPNDLATIIYTSGTTGQGKGVMLSHANFVSNFKATSSILEPKNVNKALSFLPLCHVYERMLNYMYQYLGISVYYAESLEKVGDNLRELQPDMMCAVPRMLEKIYDRFMAKGRSLKGLQRIIYLYAIRLAGRYKLYGEKGWSYKQRLKIADRLVYRKWREAVGGNLRYIVSGGASLRPRISKLFWAAGIQVMEGYGLTETSPVVAVSNFDPGGVKFGTVGPPIKGVEVRIAIDGEILVKGPNLMLGYYKDPGLTKEVIDEEGWFHTGDIGTLIEGRYLKITDRKKEIFKTSSGKYIAPQAIENRFKESSFIENILVVGENRNFAAALIVPDFEYLKGWYTAKGYQFISPANAIKDERVIQRIQREVDTFNQMLDRTEQIKKFVLLDHEWKVETGELSPTLKLRRNHLLQQHRRLIYKIYNG